MDRSRNNSPAPTPAPTPNPPTDPPTDPRRHDQSYKRIFSHPIATRSLLRLLARDWYHELDLSTIESFPTENVGADLKRRLGDAGWRVRFKNSQRTVIFLVEFQSSVDSSMALRTLRYSEAVFDSMRANPELRDPGGAIPLVLTYVVHTGPEPWTAETSVAALVRGEELPPAVLRATAELGTAHQHLVVDLQPPEARELVGEDAVLGWLAALEREPWENFPEVYKHLASQCRGEEHKSFREAFAMWTVERMRASGAPEDATQTIAEQIIELEEDTDMGYAEWAERHRQAGLEQGREQGREQGVEQGLEQGLERSRALVVRQALRRFGARTAERLAGLVRRMGAEQLDRVGDAVVECETGDELLVRATSWA